MSESTQHKLTRIRPPRVKITYDVESGDAIQLKELPLVVGLLADLSGDRDPEAPLPYLKERKFVEIDRDNFNDVLASCRPRVAFQVDNKLEEDADSKLNVELNFEHIDDFLPASIVDQVEPLAKLYEARQRLNDLIGKLDGNDGLDKLLQQVAANTDEQEEIRKQTQEAESDG